MPIVVNSNVTATTVSFNLSSANDALRNSLARLSSGKRIVNPADDAGGMAVASKLNSRLTRTSAVRQNNHNALSYLQVQDGALSTIGKIMGRMAELRTMANDVTKNSSDVENYSQEFVELQSEILQISRSSFNGISLFSTNDAQHKSGVLHRSDNELEFDGTKYNKFSRISTTHEDGASGHVSINVVNLSFITPWLSPTYWFSLGAGDTSDTDGAGAGTTNAGAYAVYYNSNGAVSRIAVPSDAYFFEQSITGDPPNQGTGFVAGDLIFQGRSGLGTSESGVVLRVTKIDAGGGIAALEHVSGGLQDFYSGFFGSGKDWTDMFPSNKNPILENINAISIGSFVEFIERIADARAENGAEQNRLKFVDNLLGEKQTNLEAAHGRIMDADIALESTRFARQNVLVQSSAAMVAQANQLTSIALTILG